MKLINNIILLSSLLIDIVNLLFQILFKMIY